jgi:predicted ATPase
LKSKKIVITGGPGTGKTSIINELIFRGYSCIEEISRQITLNARAQGIEQLFLTKPLLFSELLLNGREAQFNKAATLSKDLIFFDRGIPDILAYLDYSGDKYPQLFNDSCKNNPYDKVFILAPWQEIYISDNERYEDFNQAIEIHHQLVNTYKKYDYELVDVPFNSVKERTDHILNIVENN